MSTLKYYRSLTLNFYIVGTGYCNHPLNAMYDKYNHINVNSESPVKSYCFILHFMLTRQQGIHSRY